MAKYKCRQSLFADLKKHNCKIHIIIIYLVASLICNMLCNDILYISSVINSPSNIFDGFLMINNNLYSQLALTIGILLINSKSPFMNEDQYYALVRMGKNKWLSNRIILSILNVVLYTSAVLFFTMIFTMSNSFFGNYWSVLSRGTAMNLNSITSLGPPAGFSLSLINSLSVFDAVLHTYLLTVIYWVLLSLIMLLVNLRFINNRGFICALIIHFLGWVVEFFMAYSIGFLSPLNNCLLVYHNYGFNSRPSLLHSYIYYSILIIALFIKSKKTIYNYDFL